MNQMLLHRNGGKDRTISNSSQYLLIVVMDLKPETSLSSCQRKYIKKPINQYQTSQNVSFIFRIPKDFKIKPYLCIRFGDVSTFRICIKGNSVIESEAVPATVKPVNEKQLSPCHCFLCKKWEGAFQGEARKPAKSEHR